MKTVEVKVEELKLAVDPFRRVLNIIDAHPIKFLNDVPLRDLLPGEWPTLGDLRKLVKAMESEQSKLSQSVAEELALYARGGWK